MAQNALLTRPALGTLRQFATEDAPNAPHSIDLNAHRVRLARKLQQRLALDYQA